MSVPPAESALGALLGHLRTLSGHFQPSNVQFGLMPELGGKTGKAARKVLYAQRAGAAFLKWMKEWGMRPLEWSEPETEDHSARAAAVPDGPEIGAARGTGVARTL